jgi:hypothetical protein
MCVTIDTDSVLGILVSSSFDKRPNHLKPNTQLLMHTTNISDYF